MNKSMVGIKGSAKMQYIIWDKKKEKGKKYITKPFHPLIGKYVFLYINSYINSNLICYVRRSFPPCFFHLQITTLVNVKANRKLKKKHE